MKVKQRAALSYLDKDRNGHPLQLNERCDMTMSEEDGLRLRLLDRTALVVGGGVYRQWLGAAIIEGIRGDPRGLFLNEWM